MLIIILLLVAGFAISIYACCWCPTGQLDRFFDDMFDYTYIPLEEDE